MADMAMEKRRAPEEALEADAKPEEPPAKKPETSPVAADADVAPAAAADAAPAVAADAAPAAAASPEAATPVAASAEAARVKPAAAHEPEAKRLKPTPPDPKAVQKQVEYYLSDENLRYDKFFSEKVAADTDGWLDMQLILSCNKMQAIRATKEIVIEALKESKIEVRDGGSAVRRPGNAPLPKLEARPLHPKKSSIHAHDGGVLFALQGIPAEQNWSRVKEKLREKLPAKVQIWYVSEINDKNRCFAAVSPFDNDAAFIEEISIELGGVTLKPEVCQGELLQSALKLLPKHVRDKRERESRKRQKERNRPILIGTQRFLNMAALRGRVKEILNSRSNCEQLKPDGSDFKLIKALLGFHPSGDEKSKGLLGMKVDKASKGDNRCFYMVKEGGVEEDFSAKKCLDAIEANPPYVTETKKEVKAASSAPAAPVAAATKAEEAKEEVPAEVKELEEKPVEEKPAEEKPEEKTEAKEKPKEEAREA